jgi:hypothetical protein
MALTPNDYRMALDSQSACNASGLIHSLDRVIPKIRENLAAEGGGTDEVNRHPIVRLYAEQLLYLSGGGAGDPTSWDRARRYCEERAEPIPSLLSAA